MELTKYAWVSTEIGFVELDKSDVCIWVSGPQPPAATPPLGVGVCVPKNGRWPGASPGLFGDIVSHLPDCCSFIRIGVGYGRVLSQPPLSAEAPLCI